MAAIQRAVNRTSEVQKLITRLRGREPASGEVIGAVAAVQRALLDYFSAVVAGRFSLDAPTTSPPFRELETRVREAVLLLDRGAGRASRPAANELVTNTGTTVDGAMGRFPLGGTNKALVTRFSQVDASENEAVTLDVVRRLNRNSIQGRDVGDRAFVSTHIVDGGFGGPGTASNLVAAPDFYNTTPVPRETIKWAENQANAALVGSPISYEGQAIYGRTSATASRDVPGKMVRVPDGILTYIPRSIRLTARRMALQPGRNGTSWDHWREDAPLPGLNGQELPIRTVLPIDPPSSVGTAPVARTVSPVRTASPVRTVPAAPTPSPAPSSQ